MTKANQDLAKQQKRLQALLAKALDPSATDNERESAMTAAQNIMTKTGLAADSGVIGASDAQGVADWFHPYIKTDTQEYLHPVFKLCSVPVMRFFGCDGYLTTDPKTGGKALRILGTDSDIEVTLWLLNHLTDSLESGWKAYKATRTNRNLKVLKEARMTFVRAFCSQVNIRLGDWARRAMPDSYKNTLVVKRGAVSARMDSEQINLSAASSGPKANANIGAANVAGGLHGKGVSLGRGVGGAFAGKAIGKG